MWTTGTTDGAIKLVTALYMVNNNKILWLVPSVNFLLFQYYFLVFFVFCYCSSDLISFSSLALFFFSSVWDIKEYSVWTSQRQYMTLSQTFNPHSWFHMLWIPNRNWKQYFLKFRLAEESSFQCQRLGPFPWSVWLYLSNGGFIASAFLWLVQSKIWILPALIQVTSGIQETVIKISKCPTF